MRLRLRTTRPGLLVSVRSAEEAVAALAGGADVIDIKEPARGSLGAADRQTMQEVVGVVAGRAPVTAAVGELADLVPSLASGPRQPLPPGVELFKLGLAGCAAMTDWPIRWRQATAAIGGEARPVAVAYADWQPADAPSPAEVLELAVAERCPALLVDTWDKSAGTLFDHWPPREIAMFVELAASQGVAIVVAGSLAADDVQAASRLKVDLVAVRRAACDAGRGGRVSRQRVAGLRQCIEHASRPAAGSPPAAEFS